MSPLLFGILQYSFLRTACRDNPEEVRTRLDSNLTSGFYFVTVMSKQEVLAFHERSGKALRSFIVIQLTYVRQHLVELACSVILFVCFLGSSAETHHKMVQPHVAHRFQGFIIMETQIAGNDREDPFLVKRLYNSSYVRMQEGFAPIVKIGRYNVIPDFIDQRLQLGQVDTAPFSTGIATGPGGAIGTTQIAGIGDIDHSDIWKRAHSC